MARYADILHECPTTTLLYRCWHHGLPPVPLLRAGHKLLGKERQRFLIPEDSEVVDPVHSIARCRCLDLVLCGCREGNTFLHYHCHNHWPRCVTPLHLLVAQWI